MLYRTISALMLTTIVLTHTSQASGRHAGGLRHQRMGGGVSSFGGGFNFGYGPMGSWSSPVFDYTRIGPMGPVVAIPTWPTFEPAPFVMMSPVNGRAPVPDFRQNMPPLVRANKKADQAKSTQYVTIGDRLFRAGNLKKASERYEQALRADPDSATPRIRQAQVALVRGQYTQAADHLREALAADPGWLTHAPDIQTLFGEPVDFRRQLARLESHVLIEPNDRDAWLVLGAELYLSGQTRRASDIFLRLSDRKPDDALAAFLDAARVTDKQEK